MANNGETPARSTPAPSPVPAPAPTTAVVEPALAPLRKVPAKVVSPMDRLKAYLKEVPSIRARLVKTTEELEQQLVRSKSSIDAFDAATAKINELVKSWEEQNAGHDAPAPAPAPESIPGPGAAPVVKPSARVSVVGTTPAEPEKSGG